MSQQSGRTKTLLVADDSRATQKVISLTFGDEGWQVLVAGDADEAWRQIEAGDETPDIVLADVYMPGDGGGIKLCERIKADKRFRHIPVVLLVGAFERFDGAEARKVGADDLLTKPFQSIRDLVSRVGDLFNGRPKEQDADASLEESRDASTNADSDTSTHAEEHSTTAATVVDDNIQYDSAASNDEFADQTLDDGLIEAVPAAHFGSDSAARIGVEDVEESERVEAQSHHAPENLTIIEPLEELDSPGQANTARESNDDDPNESDDDLYITSPDVMSAPAAVAQTTPLDPLVASGADVFSNHADEQDAARQHSVNPDSVNTLHDQRLDAPFGDATDERDEDTPPLAIADTHTPTTMPHTSSSDRNASSAHEPFAEDTLLDLDDSTAHVPHVAASDALVMDDFVLDLTDDATDADNTGLDNSSDDSQRAPQSSASGVDALELLDVGESDTAPTLPTTPPNEIPVSRIEVQARDTDAAPTENVARVAFTPPTIVESRNLEANYEVSESITETATETLMPPHATSASESAQDGGALHAGQISPEVIEQIARRAVELMSERVIQEIAWEVVPQLAELLIKQRLDQEKPGKE